jgi:molybdopterin adenylyltransferase
MTGSKPLRISVTTISDRSFEGTRPDASGPALEKVAQEQGWQVVKRLTIPDDFQSIKAALVEWTRAGSMDVILTTGGTGFSPRDITPEATTAVIERPTPGIAEAMRSASLKVTPHAMLSRGTAGIRGRTLIVNLPGSPKAAVENLEVLTPVLPHAVELMREEPGSEAGHRYTGED